MARPAINRRTFVKGMGTTFVAGSVPIVLAPGHAAAGPPAGMLRPGTTYSLDGGWLFGGAVSDSPGSQWLPVSLPHCVTPLPWNNWDPASWQHQWRYRRELVLPTMHDDVRLFLDLDGVMTSATATVNGHALAPHQGGYLPFSEELTGLVQQGTNVIDLVVDATWQQVPPDGAAGGAAAVDYLEPGGITRGAALRVEPATAFIADLYAHPRDVLAAEPSLEVSVSVDGGRSGVDGQLDVSLVPAAGGRPLATSRVGLLAAAGTQSVTTATLGGLRGIRLWSPEQPVLYRVDARLSSGSRAIDQASVRTGFRQATFELDGFYLNGQRYLLFGLNRHQLYPYGGMSLPSRVQRKDAELLRQVLNCNLVRCSHYPQSPAFLDACDELGLMVWEEVPGWGYIGEAAWKELWFQDVTSTVVRDRSRPSVVIWGAQPNETSPGFADASSAKQLAKASDPDRPTGGTQTSWDNPSYVQDVYAYDDYGSTQNPDGTVDVHLRPPTADKPYLVAESVGALLPPHFYERRNAQPSQQRQAILHGQAHSLAQDPAQHYAGLVAWAGFDYSSLSGYQDQHIKTPGVADGFRNLKPGAAMYQAQVDPAERVVIQPSFSWDFGGPSPVTTLGPEALIWSNCDELRVSVGGGAASTLQPQAASFPHLAHPPFALDVSGIDAASEPDLAIEGVVNGRVLASRRFSGSHEGDHLLVQADDDVIAGDGADGTRIAIQSVDRYGAARPFVTGDAMVRIEGPGTLIGLVASLDASVIPAVVSPGQAATLTVTLTNRGIPLGATGGSGAVWLRSLPGASGPIRVTVSHRSLGRAETLVRVQPQSPSWNSNDHSSEPSPPLTDVSLTATPPQGVSAMLTSPAGWGSVAPGETVTATWTITAASAAPVLGGGTIAIAATMTAQGQPASMATSAPVPIAVQIAEAYDNTGISDDNAPPTTANFDGVGNSFSEQALTAAGLGPGATVQRGGVPFTWPSVPAGTPDNVVAQGQTIAVSGSGATLGVLGASASGSNTGSGTVHYVDGSASTFEITLPDYFNPSSGAQVAASMTYCNDSNPATNGGKPGRRDQQVGIYYAVAPIAPGKAVRAVTLPAGGSIPSSGRIIGMHVFAIAVG